MKPLLLTDWIFEDPSGWLMSEKLDGWRMLWDGRNFISRQGLVLSTPDWFKAGMPHTPLDGELFAGRGRFNFIQRMMRDGWHGLTFQVFDAPTVVGGFDARFAFLGSLLLPRHVELVPHVACRGLEHFQDFTREVVRAGGEGAVIRNPSAIHRVGRSKDVLRLVPVDPVQSRLRVA